MSLTLKSLLQPRADVVARGAWAVVTGASDGIGREIARALAERGMNLVLVARRGARLQELRRELIEGQGIGCRVVAADLARSAGLLAVLEATEPLDISLLVAAAGHGSSGEFVFNPIAAERDMLAVNCGAVLELSWHFGRRFVLRRRGAIVLMSSVMAFQGAPGTAHYAATKAWVQSFAEGLRAELEPFGVDVLASAPGPVDSGFASRANLRLGVALSPKVVAAQTVRALSRGGTVRPGWLSKLLGWSLATLPRWARVQVMRYVVAAMTAHHIEQAISS